MLRFSRPRETMVYKGPDRKTEWGYIQRARVLARQIRPDRVRFEEGTCSVYVILLRGFDASAEEIGFYVGQTGIDPDVRFKQHKEGVHSSSDVRLYGERRLWRLTLHLQSLCRAEAEDIERRLFQAFVEAGLPNVRGGH